MRIFSVLLVLGGLSLFSCNKELSPAEQLKKDVEIIENYLAEKGLTAQSTSSGLHYIITKEGSGSHPTINSNITFQYTGYLLDGTVFDKTDPGQPATFKLFELILGWQEGIQLMQRGGKATFLIPSGLAYGTQAKGSIPANSVLIFDVQLDDF